MNFEFRLIGKNIEFTYKKRFISRLNLQNVSRNGDKAIISADLNEEFLDALIESEIIVSETVLTVFLTNLEYNGYINKQEYNYYITHIPYKNDLPKFIEIKSK